MKIRNLFLLGLSAAALASCGGASAKAYKNEVKKEDFLKDLEAATKDHALLKEEPFSFEFSAEKSSKTEQALLKDGKEVTKGVMESSSEESRKYDADNNVYNRNYSTKLSEEEPGSSSKDESSKKSAMFADSTHYFSVDLESKTYYKYESSPEDSKEYIFGNAYSPVGSYVMKFSSAVYMADAKLYKDDKVFTVVYEKTETEGDESMSTKMIYQLTVEADYIEFFMSTDSSESDKNSKFVASSVEHAKIVKKSVSLKANDLGSFVDLSDDK